MNEEWPNARVLFHFNGAAVKARPSFWPMWLSTWPALVAVARWRQPRRSWPAAILVGTLSIPLTVLADVGHAMAHTISARAANAPMDEIRLAADMPRTIFFDNDVTPDQHRLRALGGPIFSAACLILSLLWRLLSRPATISRHLAEVSAASHAFIFFGSLMPLSIVDGGTLLKWTLVKRGMPIPLAEQRVRQAGIAAIVTAILAAAVWLSRRFLRPRFARAGSEYEPASIEQAASSHR